MRTPKRCLKYDSTLNFYYQIDNIIMPDTNNTTLLMDRIKTRSVSPRKWTNFFALFAGTRCTDVAHAVDFLLRHILVGAVYL